MQRGKLAVSFVNRGVSFSLVFALASIVTFKISYAETLAVCGINGSDPDYCPQYLVQKVREISKDKVVEAQWSRTETGNTLRWGEPDSDRIKKQIVTSYLSSKDRNEQFTIMAHSRGAQLVYKAIVDLQANPKDVERLNFNPSQVGTIQVDRLITLDPQNFNDIGKPANVKEWINFYAVSVSLSHPSTTANSTPFWVQKEGGGFPPPPLTEGQARGATNVPVVGDHSFYADKDFFNQKLKPLLSTQQPTSTTSLSPTIPGIASLQLRDGEIVRGPTSQQIYQVQSGQLRLIKNPPTEILGRVKPVSQETINAYPKGAEITVASVAQSPQTNPQLGPPSAEQFRQFIEPLKPLLPSSKPGPIVIDRIEPSSGAPGVKVTITGKNFNSALSGVRFGNAFVRPLSTSDSQIVIEAPASSGIVSVTVGGSQPKSFTFNKPFVRELRPQQGEPKRALTLVGENFGTRRSYVKFGKSVVAGAGIVSWEDRQIVVNAPSDFGSGVNDDMIIGGIACVARAGLSGLTSLQELVFDLAIPGCDDFFESVVKKYQLKINPSGAEGPVRVAVTTTAGESNQLTYTYKLRTVNKPSSRPQSVTVAAPPPTPIGPPVYSQAPKPPAPPIITLPGSNPFNTNMPASTPATTSPRTGVQMPHLTYCGSSINWRQALIRYGLQYHEVFNAVVQGYSFDGACQAHDECYGRCSARSPSERKKCDDKFNSSMASVCDTAWDKSGCHTWRQIYFDKVLQYGGDAYESAGAVCASPPQPPIVTLPSSNPLNTNMAGTPPMTSSQPGRPLVPPPAPGQPQGPIYPGASTPQSIYPGQAPQTPGIYPPNINVPVTTPPLNQPPPTTPPGRVPTPTSSSVPGAFQVSARALCASGKPEIDLSWSPSPGATRYDVYRNGQHLYNVLTSQTFKNQLLNSGAAYTYYVKAANSSGGSQISNAVTVTAPNCATTIATSNPPPTPPQPPIQSPFPIAATKPTPPPPPSFSRMLTVANTGSAGLRLRASPSINASVITTLSNGIRLGVIGGPVRADGYSWWQLSSPTATGWSATGEWLIPFPFNGATVTVSNTGGLGLRLRASPSLSGQVITTLTEGSRVSVVGGPVQADGYTWWNLSGTVGKGWSAVANWLVP